MEYKIIYSKRKTLCLQITRDGEITVRAPLKTPENTIADFVGSHSRWIAENLRLQKSRCSVNDYINSHENELKAAAKEILPARTEYFSKIMGVEPLSVKITSAKTRFGSCGGNNAICFSWRLMAYPAAAVDYVVVHELAHIKHHNHSAAFYRGIERYLPDYKERQLLLKSPDVQFDK